MAKSLEKCGFNIYATENTAIFYSKNGIKNIERVNKECEGGYTVVNLIEDGKVQLVINTNINAENLSDSFSMRRSALLSRVPYTTTMTAAKALVKSIIKLDEDKDFTVVALQDLDRVS